MDTKVGTGNATLATTFPRGSWDEKEEHGATPDFDSVVKEAVFCYESICRTDKDLITQKFELGKIVHEVISEKKYGDNAVGRLAEQMTKQLNKTIEPKRLYETARLYSTFHMDINKVWELEKSLSFPLTYSFLIRNCTPKITNDNAFTVDELKLHVEERMRRWENTAREIEEDTSEAELIDSSEKHDDDEATDMVFQVDGVKRAIRSSEPVSRFMFRKQLVSFKKFLSLVNMDQKLSSSEMDLIDDIQNYLMIIVKKTSHSPCAEMGIDEEKQSCASAG